VQILASNRTKPLDVIKNYIVKTLQSENAVIQEVRATFSRRLDPNQSLHFDQPMFLNLDHSACAGREDHRSASRGDPANAQGDRQSDIRVRASSAIHLLLDAGCVTV